MDFDRIAFDLASECIQCILYRLLGNGGVWAPKQDIEHGPFSRSDFHQLAVEAGEARFRFEFDGPKMDCRDRLAVIATRDGLQSSV